MKKRILAIVLASIFVFAGCSKRTDDGGAGTEGGARPAVTRESVKAERKDFLEEVEVAKQSNSDTVGWVEVPNTNISDAVVHYDKNNDYYLRLGYDKQYDFNGVYYADYRATFGDGSPEQLSPNICVYGHAMTDNMNSEEYDIKFGQLHDFRDINFAKKNPYILFTTEKENLVYEIVAIVIANSDNTTFPYNRGDLTQEETVKMMREEGLKRSIYDYGVEIQDDDKFLTLSTCIYTLPDGTALNYDTTFYRYAVIGRLLDADAELKAEVDLKENTSMTLDPDGKMS